MSNKQKNNAKHIVILLIATLGWALSACSAKIEGGGGESPIPLPKPDPQPAFAHQIQGPVVDGVWKSGCIPNGWDASKYKSITLEIQGQNVHRVGTNFSDTKCERALDSVDSTGVFRFNKLNYFGQYEVEYQFKMENGTYTQYEVFNVVDGDLFVSDLIGGDSKADVKLKKQSASQPAPAPQPNPTPVPEPVLKPAHKADRYAEAKYAFCSTQGFGTLVDFKGTDLTKNGEGRALLGSKICKTENAIKWSQKDVKITVTIKDGKPQIAFPESRYTSIEPYSYQDGIGNYGASAMMGGNSGECFFLTNNGTQGLPFVYSCY